MSKKATAAKAGKYTLATALSSGMLVAGARLYTGKTSDAQLTAKGRKAALATSAVLAGAIWAVALL